MRKLFGALGTSALCALLSCGTSGTSSSGASNDNCGKVAACGGNVVGTWKVADSCAPGTATIFSINGCTATVTLAPQLTGTVTFNADLTESSSLTGTIPAILNVTEGCLYENGADGGAVTCTQYQTSLPPTEANAVCSAAPGGGCTCPFSVPAMFVPTGTYTPGGTALADGGTSQPSITTTDPTSGATTTAQYCVSGSYLHVLEPSGFGGGMSAVTFDVVLTK